ncbi:TPA: hypothetical protein ACTW52_003365 [Klebsiella quasipneumoniae subsp. similipneumoniae]|uniref:hypothetical protein n=1 Tax=Klebsiella pneumoniae complex TaxID=3390273 RepID=UPI0027D222C7|nr:hypothetical protein [Klebsiella pneumoniae]WMB75978.1 hypothetical protein RAN66_16710 [Klebsiella pneumoniae]
MISYYNDIFHKHRAKEKDTGVVSFTIDDGVFNCTNGVIFDLEGDHDVKLTNSTINSAKNIAILRNSKGDAMSKSKVFIYGNKMSDIDMVVESAQELDLTIQNNEMERIGTIVKLYLSELKDQPFEDALKNAPESIKEEFYDNMAHAPKETWMDRIKELKLFAYLDAVEKITNAGEKLYALWDYIKDKIN